MDVDQLKSDIAILRDRMEYSCVDMCGDAYEPLERIVKLAEDVLQSELQDRMAGRIEPA